MNWKKYLSEYAWLLTPALLIILLDQATKEWVRTNLGYSEIFHPELWITQYARIMHWRNTGAAFGMFQGMSDVFTILSFLVSLAIIYYFPQVPRQEWALRLAMSLQLGGAVGNLIDRLRIGHVTDFISIGNFPVFNVADASISTGVAVLIVGMWLYERKTKQEEALAAAAGSAQTEDQEIPMPASAPVQPKENQSE